MIGKNLQKLRRQKKLTQEALAEKIGVARQTIAKWETSESTPDLDMAGRLATVLDVALDDLVNAPSEELDGMPGMSGKHMFGMVTVGDKGQIVIPAKARKLFEISAGDQLVIVGDEGQGLAILKPEYFLSMAQMIEKEKTGNR